MLIVWTWLYLPETKGKSAEELDLLFSQCFKGHEGLMPLNDLIANPEF